MQQQSETPVHGGGYMSHGGREEGEVGEGRSRGGDEESGGSEEGEEGGERVP